MSKSFFWSFILLNAVLIGAKVHGWLSWEWGMVLAPIWITATAILFCGILLLGTLVLGGDGEDKTTYWHG